MYCRCVQRVLAATTTSRRVISLHFPTHITRLRSLQRCFPSGLISTMAYTVEARGAENSSDYRLFFKNKDGNVISPFHDIPLYADKEKNILNMVVEVPRWTNAKMEIDTKNMMNPIKQDIKKGKLRYVKNCFPYHGYIWNYGALPQTWEDPGHRDESTTCKGDNDPIDVCEIGRKVAKRGQIVQVKVLGTLALIDEGETDWKILAIDVTDPLANEMNDVADIKRLMPGFLEATVNWFKIYKVPTGKPLNKFAFDGQARDREFAMRVIHETAEQWKKLVLGEAESCGLCCANVTVENSPARMTTEQANDALQKAPLPADPLPRDPEVDNNNHFVDA